MENLHQIKLFANIDLVLLKEHISGTFFEAQNHSTKLIILDTCSVSITLQQAAIILFLINDLYKTHMKDFLWNETCKNVIS